MLMGQIVVAQLTNAKITMVVIIHVLAHQHSGQPTDITQVSQIRNTTLDHVMADGAIFLGCRHGSALNTKPLITRTTNRSTQFLTLTMRTLQFIAHLFICTNEELQHVLPLQALIFSHIDFELSVFWADFFTQQIMVVEGSDGVDLALAFRGVGTFKLHVDVGDELDGEGFCAAPEWTFILYFFLIRHTVHAERLSTDSAAHWPGRQEVTNAALIVQQGGFLLYVEFGIENIFLWLHKSFFILLFLILPNIKDYHQLYLVSIAVQNSSEILFLIQHLFFYENNNFKNITPSSLSGRMINYQLPSETTYIAPPDRVPQNQHFATNIFSHKWKANKNGLSSRHRKLIPNLIMKKSRQDCSVCLEKFQSQEIIKQLPCKHIFHRTCIKEWIKLHHTCPICRFDLQEYYQQIEKKQQQQKSPKNDSTADEQ